MLIDLEALFAADERTGKTFIPSALVPDNFGAVDWERLEIYVACSGGRLRSLYVSLPAGKPVIVLLLMMSLPPAHHPSDDSPPCYAMPCLPAISDMSETGTKARGPLPTSWSRLTELCGPRISEQSRLPACHVEANRLFLCVILFFSLSLSLSSA